jgi:hypothetical protein
VLFSRFILFSFFLISIFNGFFVKKSTPTNKT